MRIRELVLPLFLSCLVMSFLLVSCSKEEEIADLSVNATALFISGKAQSLTIMVESNCDWRITSSRWLHYDVSEGSGTKTITVFADENLDVSREGLLSILWGNNTTKVQVNQSSVFTPTTGECYVRSFFGYSDFYELYARVVSCSLSDNLIDLEESERERYMGMIPQKEKEYNSQAFVIEPFSDGYVYLVPGFFLKVNGQTTSLSDMAIYIDRSFMKEENKKDISYYQNKSRMEFIEILQQAGLEYSMLASWPGKQGIRFEVALSDDKKGRYYLGGSEEYQITHTLGYSSLNYAKPAVSPSIGYEEYGLCHDRFEDRHFIDDENNKYVIHFESKLIKDIASIDLDFEKTTCPYSYSSYSTYPIVQIIKNGTLLSELVCFMYVEFLGKSLNTGDEAYCTGFESEVAVGGEVIRIDFNSGVDDDSIPWFNFQKSRIFDYYDGEFHNYEMQSINLYPTDDEGRKPLAGIAKSPSKD